MLKEDVRNVHPQRSGRGYRHVLVCFRDHRRHQQLGRLRPLAIGFALTLLAFATGHMTGGHINPAVSFGAYLRAALGLADLVGYVIAQLVGGALGAVLAGVLFARPAAPLEVEKGPAFLVEALFTFVLVYVVLNTATSKDHTGNSFYGLAIGTTVFVGASTVGSISGGSFNPAVALGLAVGGNFAWGALWMYFLAPLVGAAVVAIAFGALNRDDKLVRPTTNSTKIAR